MKYLTTFENQADYLAAKDNLSKPNVTITGSQLDEVFFHPYIHDYSRDYLTTIAREDGTISFNISWGINTDLLTSISYSTNGGETWITTNNTDDKEENIQIDVDVNEGDKVLWKGVAQQLSDWDFDAASGFATSCPIDVEGNIMSLLHGDNFTGQTSLSNKCSFWLLFGHDFDNGADVVNAKNLILPATTLAKACYANLLSNCSNLVTTPELHATILAENCYTNMFRGCTSLVEAPELPATTLAKSCYANMFDYCTSLVTAPELPVTTLANNCYQSMFQECTSLTEAPELPATTLTVSCYAGMFNGCTSLTDAPELYATTLADFCYQGMFEDCTSLTEAPELPATTLADGCYIGMFWGCTSLTKTPVLPATTLTENCYEIMFYGCTSLTKAPELPATTLAQSCYSEMFRGCTSLNSITCLATDISATDCTSNWVINVSSSGTFTKAPSMTSWTTGNNGIPANWTVQDFVNPVNFLDILWSDGTTTQTVRPTTDGVTPIGLCVAPTGFFGANEKARFMALKYAGGSSDGATVGNATGSTTYNNQYLKWSSGSATDTELTNYNYNQIVSDNKTKVADYQGNLISGSGEPIMLYTENKTWVGLEPNNTFTGYVMGDINGKQNTTIVSALGSLSNYPAFTSVLNYYTPGTQAGDWYLPAVGELVLIAANQSRINPVLTSISSSYSSDCMSNIYDLYGYWSSIESNSSEAFSVSFNTGGIGSGYKVTMRNVIPMLQR